MKKGCLGGKGMKDRISITPVFNIAKVAIISIIIKIYS